MNGLQYPTVIVDLEMNNPYVDNKNRVLDEFERKYAIEILSRHGGNISKAAAAARMDRKRLAELIKKHNLKAVRLSVMDKPPVTQRSDV